MNFAHNIPACPAGFVIVTIDVSWFISPIYGTKSTYLSRGHNPFITQYNGHPSNKLVTK